MMWAAVYYAELTRRRARRFWTWARMHPRRSALLLVVFAWMALEFAGVAVAFADAGGSVSSMPNLPPITIKDLQGVDLLHYSTLPLDRGDAFTFQKQLWTAPVDLLWSGHIVAVGWMLFLFQFLLSFEWINWITEPLEFVATFIEGTLGQTGWIPLALSISAVVCGFAFLAGRIGASLIEILVSLICSVLAIGVLANPVATLTGPDGALTWAQRWGGTTAASIAAGDPILTDDVPSADAASTILSDTLVGQLTTIFIRLPAQSVAFGHELKGACDEVFTTQMMAANPLDLGATNVRDAIRGCDPAAWEYVTHPGPGQILSVSVIQIGSYALLFIGVALAIVLIMCVFNALWRGIKLMGAVYAGVLPGVAREAIWKNFIGMYVAVLMLGLSVVMVSAFLKIITDVMENASEAGMGITAQTGMIALVVIALAISLFVVRRNAHRAGEKLGERFARMGFGSGAAAKAPNPIMQSARRIGEMYAYEKIRKPPVIEGGGNTTNVLALMGRISRPDSAPTDIGPLDVVPKPGSPNGRPAGGPSGALGGSKAAGALTAAVGAKAALGAAATVGTAAATGGTSAVVMAVGKIAGKQVMQRAIATGAEKTMQAVSGKPAADQKGVAGQKQAAVSGPKLTPASSTYQGFGRQIVIGADGTGTIAPQHSPDRTAYNITSMGQARTDDGSTAELRRRLLNAAQRRELTV